MVSSSAQGRGVAITRQILLADAEQCSGDDRALPGAIDAHGRITPGAAVLVSAPS
jgi:hypothetical protein